MNLSLILGQYLREKARHGRLFHAIKREMLLHDRLPLAELRLVQNRLLRQLIESASVHVPYYKKLFSESGLNPSEIETVSDLGRLPVLTKEEVRREYAALCYTRPGRPYSVAATTGTTGKPLKLRRDMYSINYENANYHRLLHWAGYTPGDRIAVIRGDKFDNTFYCYNPFLRRLYVSSFDLSANLAEAYALLQRMGIEMIFAYPSSIGQLASHIINLDLRPIKLKAVITSSEMVTKTLRERVRRAFHCRIFDYYGLAERVCSIMSCEYEQYHLMLDYGAENFRPAGDGVYEVVSTGLFNHSMPLINYATGDLIKMGEGTCRCGRNYPLVEEIIGRQSDFITINGRIIYSPTLTHVFYDLDDNNIIQSQFIQVDPRTVQLNLILQDATNSATLERMRFSLRKYLGEGHGVILTVNEKLVLTENGKAPFILNMPVRTGSEGNAG